MSRRAVLGAAACLTLPSMGRGRGGVAVGPGAGFESPLPTSESTPTLPSPIKGEGRWRAALAAFRSAQAQVAAIEAATAGGSVDEEEAWLPAHEAACDAAEGALARAIAAPAPDLGTFAVKLELVFARAVEPGAVDEGVVEAIMADARRLVLRGG